jgi:hypothetical protein
MPGALDIDALPPAAPAMPGTLIIVELPPAALFMPGALVIPVAPSPTAAGVEAAPVSAPPGVVDIPCFGGAPDDDD